jgi:hypothetical protein
MKAVVKHMGGGRVAGYYYLQIEGTDFCLCHHGHPDFMLRIPESDKGKNQAYALARRVNRRVRFRK